MADCILLTGVQSDPEGFIRSLDADTGPDADNPRACGVALLLCMLRKGSSHVAEAMLSYANHLQVWCNAPQLGIAHTAAFTLHPFTSQASNCEKLSDMDGNFTQSEDCFG